MKRVSVGSDDREVRGLVAVPYGVTTVIGPVGGARGTVVLICVALFTLNVAATPLKPTLLAPPKALPLKVTLLPTGPEVGSKLESLGAA